MSFQSLAPAGVSWYHLYGNTSTNRSQSRQRAALHGSQDRGRQSSLEPEPAALGLSRSVPGVALGIARGVCAAAREPARRAPAADHGGGDAAAEAGAALLAEPAGAAVSGPGAGSGDRGARSRADLHALAALSDHQRPCLSPLSGPVAETAGAAGEGGDWVRTAETGCRAGGGASRAPAPAGRAGAGGREAQAAAPRAGGFAHTSQNRPPVSAEFPARPRSSARLRRHRTPAQSPTRARKARLAPGRIARERENGSCRHYSCVKGRFINSVSAWRGSLDSYSTSYILLMMGRSTPCSWPSWRAARQVPTPSATMVMLASTSFSVCPCPS